MTTLVRPEVTGAGAEWRARLRSIPYVPAAAGAVIALLIVAAIFAPLLAPDDPIKQNLIDSLLPPAWIHGGSPTNGFLSHGAVGPFKSFYNDIAGATWADYLFMRANPKGLHFERWRHIHGCGRWFNLARDTVSDRILAVYRMGEPKPKIKRSSADPAP